MSVRQSVSQSVCLSVCLSNASIVSKRMDITLFDILVGRDTILFFFSSHTAVTKFQAEPLSRGAKYKRVEKINKYRRLSGKR